MNMTKSQRGQAIILLAFAIVALVGFAGLAIDGGRVLSDRRHAQNAADNSAFAAALAKIKGQDYVVAAQNRATSNGYTTGVNSAIVEVNLCSETGITCAGVPAGADLSEYIRVKITSYVQTTFARVLGRTQVEVTGEAIVHASGVTSNPLVLGAAIAAFRKTGTPFDGGGGGDLTVYGSGVFSNSTDTDCPNGSMKLGGSINYHVDTSFASAGSVCTHGGANLDGTITSIGQVDTPTFDIPAPGFSCGGVPASPNPQSIGGELVYQPGSYNGLNMPPAGNFRFAPGNYCFNGNLKLNGGTVVANGVNIRMNSGAFTISGSTTFNCSNVVVHSAGGSSVSMSGGQNNCTGITFYMSTGDITLNGNTTNIFTSPTSGNYKGLLIYLPENNDTSTIKITGTSNSQYTGSIIGVSSDVTINGTSDSAGFNVQVLSDTVSLGGSSNITIHYNPNELYQPPQSPTIQLTK